MKRPKLEAWAALPGLAVAAALALVLSEGGFAQEAPADFARCTEPEALSRAAASETEARQLLADCTRAIGRSRELTSASLAEALKVRGRILMELSRRGSASGDARLTRLALADFNLVLAIDPLAVEAYSTRGEIRGALADYKAALEDETTAINMRPTLYAAYFSRAEVYLKLNAGKITRDVAESAIADYRTALLSPEIQARSGAYIEAVIGGLQAYLTKPPPQ